MVVLRVYLHEDSGAYIIFSGELPTVPGWMIMTPAREQHAFMEARIIEVSGSSGDSELRITFINPLHPDGQEIIVEDRKGGYVFWGGRYYFPFNGLEPDVVTNLQKLFETLEVLRHLR